NCNPQYQWGLNYPAIGFLAEANTTPYFLFGDRVSCGTNCLDTSKWKYNTADGLITFLNQTQGDTLVSTYQLDSKVIFKDLAIKAKNLDMYTCNPNPPESLPWHGATVSGFGSVPADYPLQATINFLPPDGRTISITNGVSAELSTGIDWKQVEIMFGLKSRNTDCRVVIFTKEGVIGQYVDSNCDFNS
ncbi:MAG: hypothetical protein COT26_01890, partial [Candidatus Kerfeldbacteria bacterium CG08_land_8_20_14_0_20_43_14]